MANRTKRPVVVIVLLAVVGLGWWWWSRSDEGEASAPAATAKAHDGPRGKAALDLANRDQQSKLALLPWQREAGSISGKITSAEDAAPLVNADVCLVAETRDAPSSLTRQPRCEKTGSDGYYRFTDVRPMDYEVNAALRGYLPGEFRDDDDRRELRLRPGQQRVGVDLALRPGGVEIKGVVRDLAGGVVEGALVSVSSGSFGAGSGTMFTTTDSDGQFTGWVDDGGVRVTATAEGYGEAHQSGAAPGFSFELFLTPESVVSGRVVLAGTTTPVPNAMVSAGDIGWWNQSQALTDADGRFELDRLGPGQYHPTAVTENGYGRAKMAVHVGLAQSAGPVVIELHPAASVRGQIVIAGTDGEPCKRGSVRLDNPKTDKGARGETELDGAILIRGIKPGTYEVTASCEGYRKQTDTEDLEIGTEPIDGQVWEVEAGLTIGGLVVNADGDPIKDARVWASMLLEGRAGTQQWASDRTEADGTFQLAGVVAGRYNVSASADDYLRLDDKPEIEVSERGAEPIKITLERGGSIRGRVVDQHGEAVAGANVQARGTGGRSWRNRAHTVDDGTFELDNVEPGPTRVSANKGWRKRLKSPGKSDDDLQGELIEVARNEVAEVELVVETLDGTISGTVTDAGGGPVSDAFINCDRESESAAAAAGGNRRSVRWGSWGRKPILTDQDGAFTCDELSGGKYTIRAFRKGGGEAITEHIDVGASGVALEIETTGSISGTVKIVGGGAPDEFEVSARDKAAGITAADRFYKTGGEWALREVPAGNFEISVTSSDGDAIASAELTTGQDLEGIDVELVPKVVVSGRLLDLETKEPVPGLEVSIAPVRGGFSFRMGGKGDQENVSDDSGRFTVENASAGEVRVTAVPRSFNTNTYAFTRVRATIPTEGKTFELGDVFVVPKRRKRSDDDGDLGFKTKNTPPGVEDEDAPLEVAFVRPGGPAAAAGLEVGATIEAVDGHSVTGNNRYRYRSLTDVVPGTEVKLGLGEDKSVTIVAGAQP
ncbi:MAG: carboxypeptidase regulatory-like domain-containing protein [Myxococcota bacterium]